MSTETDPQELDSLPHEKADISFLLTMYDQRRWTAQTSYYEKRIEEYEYHATSTDILGTLLLGLGSLCAAISAAASSLRWLSIFAALLPALAGVFTSFQQVYGWERQLRIYHDALFGLKKARINVPDSSRLARSDVQNVYITFVNDCEKVLTSEVNQWGQYVPENAIKAKSNNTPGNTP